MTDNEIVKALEEIAKDKLALVTTKAIVPYRKILDLINRLQADKEALIAGQETLQKALAEKIAEVEKLTNLCQEQNIEIKRQIEIKNRFLYNLKLVCEEKVGDAE